MDFADAESLYLEAKTKALELARSRKVTYAVRRDHKTGKFFVCSQEDSEARKLGSLEFLTSLEEN